MGAVQYGTSKGFSPIGPHGEAQALRQEMPHVMAPCSKRGTEGVMVVDRRGSHRAHQLDVPLAPYHKTWRCHCFPAHGGHHLNPIEGVWRVMKDPIGAGRWFTDLRQLDQRTRQGLMAHQERPIYAFHW